MRGQFVYYVLIETKKASQMEQAWKKGTRAISQSDEDVLEADDMTLSERVRLIHAVEDEIAAMPHPVAEPKLPEDEFYKAMYGLRK